MGHYTSISSIYSDSWRRQPQVSQLFCNVIQCLIQLWTGPWWNGTEDIQMNRTSRVKNSVCLLLFFLRIISFCPRLCIAQHKMELQKLVSWIQQSSASALSFEMEIAINESQSQRRGENKVFLSRRRYMFFTKSANGQTANSFCLSKLQCVSVFSRKKSGGQKKKS